MKNRIIKSQNGSNSNTWQEGAKAVSYMIPVYGTYLSIKDAIDDPSLANIGMAGLSLAGDVGTLFGAGALLKGAVGASKAAKALNAATKVYNTAHAAESIAIAGAREAAREYSKAANKVKSLTLLNAPISKITEAQKTANVAKANALSKYKVYREASIAARGIDPTYIKATVNAGNGTMQKIVTKDKLVGKPSYRSVYSGALGDWNSAINEAAIADQVLDVAKTNAKLSIVGNVGAHAAGAGIGSSKFSQNKKKSGNLNYLKHYK